VGWKKHLAKLGYDPEVPMSSKLAEWWGWYMAVNDWYGSETYSPDGRTTYRVERLSIKPARMVCQEYASLIMNERTMVATSEPGATALVDEWLAASRFMATAPRLVERSFALGTGAWALRVGGVVKGQALSPAARIVPQRFDARQIVPLTYDEDDCTECAFVSTVAVRGRKLDQLQVHRLSERGTYLIELALFDERGRSVEVDGVAPLLDTRSAAPTFALVRPGLENPYWDYGPFGVSVFDDAIGAVKLTDAAVDNMYRDIWLGQKMLFLDERMLGKDASGNIVVPREADQQLFRRTEADDGAMIEEYNPDLRVESNRLALRTALEVLGARCGMGNDYFSLEGVSGVRTATEVNAEQSDLFRNVHKHENELGPAIARIVTGVLAMMASVKGVTVPDPGEITVTFDDSIIDDTATRRKRDLEDIAAGLMMPWEYRVKWYGEDETTARAITETEGLPTPEF
jgi:A118 family predicted phage portal protein